MDKPSIPGLNTPPQFAAPTPARGAPGGAGAPTGGTPGAPVAPNAPAPSIATLPAAAKRRILPIPNILIVGESGTGKTRSLKNLPWASGTVAYIDTERKAFDWINRIPEECYFPVTSPDEMMATMMKVEMNDKFKLAVVDSFTGYSIFSVESIKTRFSGYDQYKQYTSAIVRFLTQCSSPKKRWIVTAIPEILKSGESEGNTYSMPIKRAAVAGREMEGKVEPFFAYSVHMRVVQQQNAKPKHVFVLYSDGSSQSKIPEGVTDVLTMDNDVNELINLATKAEQQY